MRILWLKSDLLLPLDKGGKLRTWHLMRHLAERHDITYMAFAEPDQPAADVDGMREVASRVETIPLADAPKGSLRFYADAALHLVDPLPYAVAKYRSFAFRRRLNALLAEQAFDLIVCDFLFPAVNLPQRLPCPAVIFTHNVESEIWRRHAETKSGPLMRLLYGMQYRRMLRYEERTLRRFDGVLAVSDADRDTFAQLYPGAIRRPVHVVPTGVDTEFFAPESDTRTSRAPGTPIARLHRLDGLAAERGRDALLLPRHPAAHPRAGAGRARSRSSDARRHPRSRASPAITGSRSPAASTMCGRICGMRRSTSCRCASAAARA